ncbi:unnamed protein product [Candidatus Protochlamydia amoebophila UWE25]|uniref:Uncharacterized protein n=1 Tax=Protochlamydia amoebophila (strain UWE25) TaxID=264201 RepID=Q6MB71_PARUW|nr:unnamed protein product [Candidatus Protochlamydia amoebophila UWE25]
MKTQVNAIANRSRVFLYKNLNVNTQKTVYIVKNSLLLRQKFTGIAATLELRAWLIVYNSLLLY